MKSFVERKGGVTRKEFEELKESLPRAVATAAGHGLEHRDIHDANILVCKQNGQMKATLIDLGNSNQLWKIDDNRGHEQRPCSEKQSRQ